MIEKNVRNLSDIFLFLITQLRRKLVFQIRVYRF